MTPNRNNNENDEIILNRNRQRRLRSLRPLPLCLSDNGKNMPVLTVNTTEEDSNNNVFNKYIFLNLFYKRLFFIETSSR